MQYAPAINTLSKAMLLAESPPEKAAILTARSRAYNGSVFRCTICDQPYIARNSDQIIAMHMLLHVPFLTQQAVKLAQFQLDTCAAREGQRDCWILK